jgi:hypothetical protein
MNRNQKGVSGFASGSDCDGGSVVMAPVVDEDAYGYIFCLDAVMSESECEVAEGMTYL